MKTDKEQAIEKKAKLLHPTTNQSVSKKIYRNH
jgi:hypothetical protein